MDRKGTPPNICTAATPKCRLAALPGGSLTDERANPLFRGRYWTPRRGSRTSGAAAERCRRIRWEAAWPLPIASCFARSWCLSCSAACLAPSSFLLAGSGEHDALKRPSTVTQTVLDAVSRGLEPFDSYLMASFLEWFLSGPVWNGRDR